MSGYGTSPKTKFPPKAERRTWAELKAAKQSMLDPHAMLPIEYGLIESTEEAMAAAVPPAKGITLRMTIVWDNEVANLTLDRVLDQMRETGAAFVVSVEQVT